MNRLELASMRERYGYAFRELGEACGLSHQYISLLEKGERTLTPELAKQIMDGMYKLSMDRAAKAAESEKSNGSESEPKPAAAQKADPVRRRGKKTDKPRASCD